MPANLNNLFGIHETALKVRAQRSELLSSNLANADTPNYKARDIDFKSVLESYQGQAAGANGLRTTNQRHISTAPQPGGEPMYRVPSQPSIDGNTVDSQREKAEFMQNALRYQASLQFVDGKLKGLLTAIRGD